MNQDTSRLAAENRKRISNRDNIQGYLLQEKIVRGWAIGELPPKGIRFGELPQAKDLTWREGDVVDWIWRAE